MLFKLLSSCAEDAVSDDIENSTKKRKQVATELYGDLTVAQATQKLTDTINSNKDSPKLGAEQAIRICLIAGEGATYLGYVFEHLKETLNIEQAEAFVKHVCNIYGFKTPEKVNVNEFSLEKEKMFKVDEIKNITKLVFQKVRELEDIEKKLEPIKIIND
jgi:hypothetical protein